MCERCHSVTLLPGEKYSMKNWCKTHNIPDYSERLATLPNIIHLYGDSKEFDFSSTKDEIDIYFIDGDHSYSGVKADTENIFRNRKPDSFVVWHDFLGWLDPLCRRLSGLRSDSGLSAGPRRRGHAHAPVLFSGTGPSLLAQRSPDRLSEIRF